jgi:hypothetical protein
MPRFSRELSFRTDWIDSLRAELMFRAQVDGSVVRDRYGLGLRLRGSGNALAECA